jgi:hypothetical protein
MKIYFKYIHFFEQMHLVLLIDFQKVWPVEVEAE